MSIVFVDEFALSPALIGPLIGAMFIAQGLGQVPGGIVLDRFGTRRTLAGFGLLAALGSLMVALAGTWQGVMVGRVLIGIGFAPALNGSISFFVRWAGNARLSTLTGRFLFVGMLGGIVGTGPLSLAIESYGWRPVYAALGVLTLMAAASLPLLVRDGPPRRATDTDNPAYPRLADIMRGMRQVFRNREIRPLLLISPFLYTPTQLLVGLWAGPYLADIHRLNAVDRGYALTIMMVGMSIGVLAYGPIEAKIGRRRPVVIGGALTVAASFLALAFWGQQSPLIAIAACSASITFSTYFVVVIAHAQSLFPREFSGRSVAVIGLIAITGVFVNQSLSAALVAAFPAPPGATASLTGYRTLFIVVAIVFAGIAAVYSRVREQRVRS
nr:MFS transporter [Pseudohoeflea sp. DP4N28-3]